MSRYIPDISSKRWVIISPQRVGRPNHNKHKSHCPLCPGHEKETPPEVLRYGKGEKDKPGWTVRVVPNKYPIVDIHEVIIHSPDSSKDLEALPLSHTVLILKAYRERYNTHKKRGQVLIFCNHGEHAGASLDHPHSQLVVIPSQINLDALSREPLNNIVEENKYFYVYCPDFSQWPYEVWIAPKKQGAIFGDITDDELVDFAQLLQETLRKLRNIYKKTAVPTLPFGYNFYIFHREDWYIRIIPRFIHRAGFELGTGLSVNIVDPLDASIMLKDPEKKLNTVIEKLKKY